MTVEPVRIIPPTNSRPLVKSDSESKVGASDKELLTLQRIMTKVRWVDNVEHVLDKEGCMGSNASQVSWMGNIYLSW